VENLIELAYFRGRSQREISERTGMSPGTFKSRTESAFKIFKSTRCHTHPEQTSSRASCPRLTPEVGEWTRHLKAMVDVLEFLELLPEAETGSQVAPDLGGLFRIQPAMKAARFGWISAHLI
jgi:hypothetical protein